MIDIESYGTKDKSQKTKISTGNSSNSNYENDYSFYPVYLWGQYFDDTQDIDGDMKVNGTIEADGIKALEMEVEEMSADNLDVKEKLTAKAGNISDLETKNFKADKAKLKAALVDELASTNLVTENLTVTRGAHFFELIIDKIRAAGGAILLTPADGFKVDKVEWIDDTHCKLWWRSEDDGRKIHNMWMADDQAISQNFNDAKVGKTYDVSSKYWWALVTETNNETNNGEPVTTQIDGTDQQCHYIIVSAAKYEFVGDVNPEVGDDIAMLGSRVDDKERQSAQYLSAYASLDMDLKAPLFVQYEGIDDFDLASHKKTWFAAGLTGSGSVKGLRENEITGSFRTSDGKKIEDLIEEAKAGTIYRLVSSTTTVKKSNGGYSPSALQLSIIINENGQASNTDIVPEMIQVFVNDANTNERLATYYEGQTMTFSDFNGHTNLIACIGSTTSSEIYDKLTISVIEDQEIDISQLETELTSFDRLVDNGCLAKVIFETNDQAVTSAKIKYNIDVMVMHYEGTDVFQVATGTTPKISEFRITYVWDKTGGGGSIGSATNNSFKTSGELPFAFDNENSDDYKSFLKIMLWKGSKKLDTIVIPVTVKSGALFEVVQGSMPYILSQVTASLQDGEYGEIKNYMSQVLQKADELSSMIESFNSEGVSQSIIDQTADNVLIQVSNSLSTAGINVTNNTITLTGEKTDINGSLNIYGGTGNGFKVWNNTKGNETQSVQITNTSLGVVQDYFINNIVGNANSVNVIGMDGAAFTPNYNQMLWWGKSSEGLSNEDRKDLKNTPDRYEFIVRNNIHNLRVNELGIYRTISYYFSASGIDSNLISVANAGKNLLNNNDIKNASKWGDISTTTPVYEFYGDHDFTTNGSEGSGLYPDANFRKCGIFILVSSTTSEDSSKITLPDPMKCPGRTIIIKNMDPNKGLILKTNMAGSYPFMHSGDSNVAASIQIGHNTCMLISSNFYWIVFV